MTHHLEKFNGIYNLEERLREIDSKYRLFYNKKNKHFELYSRAGLFLQKELDFGEKIDSSIIEKTRMSRRENIAKLIKSMDKFNEKLEENAFLSNLDKSKQIARELINYADKTSRDLSENELKQIING